MKKSYNKVLQLVALIVVFYSCNFKTERNSVEVNKSYKYNLIPLEKTLKFHLNNRIINRSLCLLPYTDDDKSRFLFYLSAYTNNISVFSIDSEKLVKTIKLESVGPDGVGNVMGFEVINFDSIYVTPEHIRKLYLVNGMGKVISSIDYSSYSQEYVIYSGTSRTLENMKLGFKDGLIYLPFYPGIDEGNYKSISPENVRFVSALNTSKKTVKTLNIGFPEDYWEDKFYPSFFGFFMANNKFYINYMYDDRIACSTDSKIWKTYIVPSKYANVKNIIPGDAGCSSTYDRLVYDKYRDIFYRFVSHEETMNGNKTIKDIAQYPEKFSIIILDKDLNIIGETLFKDHSFDIAGYFVNEDGLYLSRSNPFNSNYNIDLLDFQLFQIKKDES